MIRLFYFILALIVAGGAGAQTLSLDTCMARALQHNKQVNIARVKQQMAMNTRKVARTKYLPHVDVLGGYMYSSREISLLNDTQKDMLGNMGNIMASSLSQGMSSFGQQLGSMAAGGLISPQTAKDLAAIANAMGPGIASSLKDACNKAGQELVDAFSTNTHHIFTASAVLTQPLYMGGAITAGNKMADIAEEMAGISIEAKEEDVVFTVNNAYWMVVSLRQKQQLADNYLALVQKLSDDVHKMIKEGVATRADGLKVDVAVNEAEMTKTQVDNALSLSRMYLCKVCGMPLDSDVRLVDEEKEEIAVDPVVEQSKDNVYERRNELKLLSKSVDLTKQQIRIARAAYMPQLSLMGGVFFTNPSVYNSFERKFKGAFNIGVMMRVPVLDWGDAMYKVRVAKCSTNLAQLAYDEAKELIDLQISQSSFKVQEASKKLGLARKNIEQAEENLRCANLGFKEGVMPTTDVMAAQTAWLKAKTQKIDAEIDMKLSEITLKKAYGVFEVR